METQTGDSLGGASQVGTTKEILDNLESSHNLITTQHLKIEETTPNNF